MNENIRVENWCGYSIRFVEHDGAWYAVLKDICDALGLRTDNTKLRIDSLHLRKLAVECLETSKHYDIGVRSKGDNLTRSMLCVDEAGIYQALSRSTRLEARQFIDWFTHSLVSLRKAVGLESYEALRLTESSIQEAISKKIDIPFVEPTGDLIPVKAEPTIVNQHIHNHNHYDVNYGKVALYTGIGVLGAVVVYHGVKYVVRKVKAKKEEKEE